MVGDRRASPFHRSTSTFVLEGDTASPCSRQREANSVWAESSRRWLLPGASSTRSSTRSPIRTTKETLVALTFFDHLDGTKLVLDQGFFATEARYGLHQAGWTDTLDRLAAFLA